MKDEMDKCLEMLDVRSLGKNVKRADLPKYSPKGRLPVKLEGADPLNTL